MEFFFIISGPGCFHGRKMKYKKSVRTPVHCILHFIQVYDIERSFSLPTKVMGLFM